jgi:glycosyltransferase involved in cell wall biosynthesis
MSEELITVVMPVYRTPDHYVREAINSIVAQDYSHLELMIIEDPSDKIVADIIREFDDGRIIYVLNHNRTSFVRQINKGIELAKGNLIARMDADDISESNRLSIQHLFLHEHQDISAVGSNLSVINEHGVCIGYRSYPEGNENIANKMRIRNAIAHPAVMFRKKDYLEVGGYNDEFDTIADYDLWIRMLLTGKHFHNIQLPLLKYRLHAGATKGYLLKKQLTDTLRIKKKYFRWNRGWNISCEARFLFEHMLRALPSKWVYSLFVTVNVRK